MKRKSDEGSILTQALVVTGLLTIAATGVLSMSQLASKTAGQANKRQDFKNLVTMVQNIINDPTGCTQNLNPIVNPGYLPGTFNLNQLQMPNGAGGATTLLTFNDNTVQASFPGLKNLQAKLIISSGLPWTPWWSPYATLNGTLRVSASRNDDTNAGASGPSGLPLTDYQENIPVSLRYKGATNIWSYWVYGTPIGPAQLQGCTNSKDLGSHQCVLSNNKIQYNWDGSATALCQNGNDMPISGGGICGTTDTNGAFWNNLRTAAAASGVSAFMVSLYAGLLAGMAALVIAAVIFVLITGEQNLFQPEEYGKYLTMSYPVTTGNKHGWLVQCTFAHSKYWDAIQVDQSRPVAVWTYCCPQQ